MSQGLVILWHLDLEVSKSIFTLHWVQSMKRNPSLDSIMPDQLDRTRKSNAKMYVTLDLSFS